MLVLRRRLARLDADAHAVELRCLQRDVVAVLPVALVPVRVLDDDLRRRVHLLGRVDQVDLRLLGHEAAAVVGPGLAAALREALRARAVREEPVVHDDLVEDLGQDLDPPLEESHVLRVVVAERAPVRGDDGAGDRNPAAAQVGRDLPQGRHRGRVDARVVEVELRDPERREIRQGRDPVLRLLKEGLHVPVREEEGRLDVVPPRRGRRLGAKEAGREHQGSRRDGEGQAMAGLGGTSALRRVLRGHSRRGWGLFRAGSGGRRGRPRAELGGPVRRSRRLASPPARVKCGAPGLAPRRAPPAQ